MSGLYPSPPDPLSPKRGEGRKRTEITQIHWDFESRVLRNVGKDEASRPWIHERARATHGLPSCP